VADVPQFIVLKRNRDLEGMERKPWARRILLLVLIAPVVAGLANAFGQEHVVSEAAGPTATLSVDAPDRLRGGLLDQARFRISAKAEIEHATLLLDEGWVEQIQINTIEPAPLGEAFRNGRLALDFGHVPAGDRLDVYIQFQVNPTNVGSRSQGVELADGDRVLAAADREVTVFP
jgi:hypothetical protein